MKKLTMIIIFITTVLNGADTIKLLGISIGEKFEGMNKSFVDENKHAIKASKLREMPTYSYMLSEELKPFKRVEIYTTPISEKVYKINAYTYDIEYNDCKSKIQGIIKNFSKKLNTTPVESDTLLGYGLSLTKYIKSETNMIYGDKLSITAHCGNIKDTVYAYVKIIDDKSRILRDQEKEQILKDREKHKNETLLKTWSGDKALNNAFVN